MKYQGYKIEKSGLNYVVVTPNGERWAEQAANRATAKKWIDAHLIETRANNPKRETLKEAGYTYVRALGDGEHLLRDSDGKYEVWFANRGHASYGLKWNNTDLEFARSAAIPNYGKPDVLVRNEGSIFLLTPITDRAREWIAEHIPNSAQYMGRSLVVEHRYAEDIVAGMQRDGLSVK